MRGTHLDTCPLYKISVAILDGCQEVDRCRNQMSMRRVTLQKNSVSCDR